MKESITFRTEHKEDAQRIIADKIAKGGDRKLNINRLMNDLLGEWVRKQKMSQFRLNIESLENGLLGIKSSLGIKVGMTPENISNFLPHFTGDSLLRSQPEPTVITPNGVHITLVEISTAK